MNNAGNQGASGREVWRTASGCIEAMTTNAGDSLM